MFADPTEAGRRRDSNEAGRKKEEKGGKKKGNHLQKVSLDFYMCPPYNKVKWLKVGQNGG